MNLLGENGICFLAEGGWAVEREPDVNSASFSNKKKGDYAFSLGWFAFIHQIRSHIFSENIGFS